MNKKANKMISVYWFAILFLVAAVVVYMAAVFYGEPYDVKEIEANLLIDKIAGCISGGGKLSSNWNNLNQNNLLDICSLNFDVEDFGGWENNQYYAEINSYNFSADEGIIQSSRKSKSSAGNSGLNELCGSEGKYMPVCFERQFYVLDSNAEKKYIIEIKSVVGKADKNVQ